jgi:hypothetical protein
MLTNVCPECTVFDSSCDVCDGIGRVEACSECARVWSLNHVDLDEVTEDELHTMDGVCAACREEADR